MCVAVSQVPVSPPALVGQSLLVQHADIATQMPAAAHFLGVEPPQVKPHVVPSQVAVAPAGTVHGVQLCPHVAGDVFSEQVPAQSCFPLGHVVGPAPPMPAPPDPPVAFVPPAPGRPLVPPDPVVGPASPPTPTTPPEPEAPPLPAKAPPDALVEAPEPPFPPVAPPS